MRNFYSIAAAALLLGTATAAAQTSNFEVDGVYYSPRGTQAWIVAPPDGSKYTGNFTYSPFVEYEGTRYLAFSQSMNAGPYEIETLTISEGWDTAEGRYNQQFFRDIPTLRRINVLSAPGEEYAGGYSRMSISVGNVLELINLSTIAGETESIVRIEKFEVYGPDGKKLQPFLIYEGIGTRIYPDENGEFHLAPDFRAPDGKYCGVLPVSGYTVVFLNVEVNGKMLTIRVEPAPAQGTPVQEVDGLFVQKWITGLRLMPAPEGHEYPETTMVSRSVTIDGKEFPITYVDENAFVGVSIKKLFLMGEYQSSVTVQDCPSLEEMIVTRNNRVTMRRNHMLTKFEFPYSPEISGFQFVDCDGIAEVKIPEGSRTFDVSYSSCRNLSSVSIPETVTELGSFTDCPLLTELNLPESTKLISSLYGNSLETLAIPRDFRFGSNALGNSQAGLFEVELVENAEDYVKVRINSHVTDMDGNVLPVAAAPSRSFNNEFYGIAYPDRDGIITLYRTVTIDGFPYSGLAWGFAYDASKGDYTLGLTPANLADYDTTRYLTWFKYSPPRYQSGVSEVEADDSNAPVEYYNLQGIRVENPAAGLYIRRQGRNVSKVFIP